MTVKKPVTSFYEDFLEQPLKAVVCFKPVIRKERLWFGYAFPTKPVEYILCPYKIGQCIPERIVKIQVVYKEDIWKWLVTCEISNF